MCEKCFGLLVSEPKAAQKTGPNAVRPESHGLGLEFMGHKTRAVFDRYHIVSPADLQAAAQKIDAAATSTPASAHNATVTTLQSAKKARG